MTQRRTKGEGSITQLNNGKWRARLECDPVDGKRKWLSKTVNTKQEAIKALQELIRKKDDLKVIDMYGGNFPDIVASYLNHTRLTGTRESTVERYEAGLRFWCELFKHKRIDYITVPDINEGINILHKQERATSTIGMELTVLSQVFNFAIDCDYIKKNPVTKSAKPKRSAIKTQSDDLQILTHEEHVTISKYLRKKYDTEFIQKGITTAPARLYVMYSLAYTTGLRVGELAALEWSDIDFDNHTLSITKQLTQKYEITEPKTQRSKRTIEISEEILSKLKELKSYYTIKGYQSNFLFPLSNTNSKPIHSPNISLGFKNTILKLNLNEHLTFHSIRHTHATELIENKIPITVVSERLGHASVMVTLEIYAHPTPTSRHQAAQICKLVA